jgi:predicted methyltransferase
MKRKVVLVATLVLASVSGILAAAEKIPESIEAAVADKNRPEADTKRDADRKPAEVVAFAGIKPGERVVDLLPGGGYFTRIFAKVVGPKGHVYAVLPDALVQRRPQMADGIKAIAADKEYSNVSLEVQTLSELKLPEPVDVVWTSLNYHDLKNPGFGADTIAMDKAIFAALKPGGTFIVIDHVANAGVADAPQTLHRIDPAIVKQEVTEAGFTFAGESNALHRADDDHTRKMSEVPRGQTDQFVYRFVKPKK